MIDVVSENTYIEPNRNGIFRTITNTSLEHRRKYPDNRSIIEFEFKTKFFDKIKKKFRNITSRKKDQTMIASRGRYEYIEINKTTILIRGEKSKKAIDTFMECGNSSRLSVLFFLNIANNRGYVYIFCNRPCNKFDRYCRECFYIITLMRLINECLTMS